MTSEDDNKFDPHARSSNSTRSPSSLAASPAPDSSQFDKSAIKGPISVVPGEVPPQQRAWAKPFLQMFSTGYQPQGEGRSSPHPITEADFAAVEAAPITKTSTTD